MPQFFVAIHHPDNYVPSLEDDAMIADISDLNREMIAAGVRNLACGLSPASQATSLRAQSDGSILVTEGAYLETREHVGGFWILETPDMDQAVAWARKAVAACRAPVEVRALLQKPPQPRNYSAEA